jgi:hypothetical protein
MSTSQAATDTCAYCNQVFSISNAVAGSYCSEPCQHRHKGQKLLNTIQHTHTYCGSCGSKLKDIEPPKPEWAFDESGGAWDHTDDGELTYSRFGQEESHKAAIGFEYTTDKADSGLKTAYQTESFESVTSGIVCGECGNASLSDPQADLRKRFLFEYTSQILDSLRERKADGEFDCEIDEQQVFDVLTQVPDLPLAIGIARE